MKRSKRTSLATLLTLISSATIAFSADYTVQSGDTLWRISVKHKVSVTAIQQANGLSGNTIQLGQVLTIPSKAGSTIASATQIESHASPTRMRLRRTHIVRNGETLQSIARNYKTTVPTLRKLNRLNSEIAEVGQVLSVYVTAPSVKQSTKITEKAEIVAEKLPVNSELPKAPSVTATRVASEVEPSKEDEPLVQKEDIIDPMSPLPPVPVSESNTEVASNSTNKAIPVEATETETSKPKGLEALSEKQQVIVRQQIILDRNGMGPGIIDGYAGDFTKTANVLAESHRSEDLQDETPLLVQTEIPSAVLHYINPTLPGTGKRPDFKQATEDQCLMMYQTAVELLAERYHCSEKLLAKMNPQIDFVNLSVGEKIIVPNVAEFKIEEFMTPQGEAVTYKYLRNSRRATRVDVDYLENRILIWCNNGSKGSVDELLASFPVTTNVNKGPKTQRTIAYFAPAPGYMRSKTGLKLKPGPNSPVGIVWAKLGDGFGIHGTSDGSGNGYNTSSGCIRLSNWDMAIFVKIVPSKTTVNFITGASIAEKIEPSIESKAVSMIGQQ